MGGKNHADLENFQDIYPYGVCFDVFIQPLTDIDGDPIPYLHFASYWRLHLG